MLVFTTDQSLNETKTDSTGAFTQSERLKRHNVSSFITTVDLKRARYIAATVFISRRGAPTYT
jgi:hypothetical protein